MDEDQKVNDYRITRLESDVTDLSHAVQILSDGFQDIVSTIRSAKWAFAVIFGLMQPVVIGVVIHQLTKG